MVTKTGMIPAEVGRHYEVSVSAQPPFGPGEFSARSSNSNTIGQIDKIS